MINAKNGHIKLKAFEMDYIRFGNGERTLVMIPGGGDGLKTVRGMAAPFAALYRSLAKSRKSFRYTCSAAGKNSCRA